jgi:hypothetical protein
VARPVPALPTPAVVQPFPSRQPAMTTNTLEDPGGTNQVAVRALCEFSARTGDLALRFTRLLPRWWAVGR